jgi:hypothetical protein
MLHKCFASIVQYKRDVIFARRHTTFQIREKFKVPKSMAMAMSNTVWGTTV